MLQRRWLFVAGVVAGMAITLATVATTRDAQAQITAFPGPRAQIAPPRLEGYVCGLVVEDTENLRGCYALIKLDGGGHAFVYSARHRVQTVLEQVVMADKHVTIYGPKMFEPPDIGETFGHDVYLIEKVSVTGHPL